MHRVPACLILALLCARIPSAQASEGGGEGPPLVAMDAIVVPIIDAGRIVGKLRFKLVLLAHDPEAAARLTAEVPRLRSIALSAGNNFASFEATPAEAVDARLLVQRLEAQLKSGAEGIDRVLLVEVVATR